MASSCRRMRPLLSSIVKPATRSISAVRARQQRRVSPLLWSSLRDCPSNSIGHLPIGAPEAHGDLFCARPFCPLRGRWRIFPVLGKRILAAGAVLFAAWWPSSSWADMPWPSAPGPARYDYETYLRSNTLPNDFSLSDYKVTSASDPSTGRPAQELGGVEGASVDKAWQVSTGRPDIHIAVLDSGIIWDDYGKMLDLRNKVALNWAELPPPQAANGVSSCQGVALPARNQKSPSPGFPPCYDANHDGAFTVDDYAADARVNPPNHAHFCCGSAIPAQNLLTPEDLIQVFSCYDATNAVEPVGHFINISATGPRRCDNGAENADKDGNGFAHDIAGWNFMEHTNDAFDEPKYAHGSGEARDSNAEANNSGSVGTCPSCMVMPLKV